MKTALERLSEDVAWCKVSHVYETAPMYVEDQPTYFNAAAAGETTLGPFALLDRLKAVEAELGRKSAARNAPREIDLDLIVYGALQLHSIRGNRTLELPHSRTVERRFVLAPLADLDPAGVLPGLGRIDELLGATKHQSGDVKILNDAVLSIRRHG